MHVFHSPFFYARQHICYSAYMLRQFHLSVRLSHAWFVSKRLNASSKFFLPSDRRIILVFRHQALGSLRKSESFTPNRGVRYKGCSNFRPLCGYISETVIDRGMEDEYKVVCALSNSAVFNDLEWPRTPVSRSQYSLKANISQTVHPIHSMFGYRLPFSRSADRMALFAVR